MNNNQASPAERYLGPPSAERTSSQEWRAHDKAFSKFSEFSKSKRSRRVTETKTDTSTYSNIPKTPPRVYVTEFDGAGNLRQTIDGEDRFIIIGKKLYSSWKGKCKEVDNRAWRFGVFDDLARDLRDVQPGGQETVNGVACVVYTIRYVEGYAGKLWIGLEDGLPHQLDADQLGASWHIVFEYDVDVKIEKPGL